MASNYYIAHWCWRDYEVKALVTKEQRALLDKYPDVKYCARDFRGYGNDEVFTPRDFMYQDLEDEGVKWFIDLCVSTNEEVIERLICKVVAMEAKQ